MSEFNPFENEFDPTVDPITADQHGLAVLDKLEEGENMRGDFDEEFDSTIDAGKEKLIANLQRYKDYKTGRGEDLFSYEDEARSRSKGFNEEKIARETVKSFQADEETFRSQLVESGEAEEFDAWNSFMPEGQDLKKRYLLKKTMKGMGFSEREISSGFAEPQFRQLVQAGEHEPTEDAALRWGLDRTNVFDRRKKISMAASELASVRFLGMAEDKDTFEKELAEANPDLTDDERKQVRVIRATQLEALGEKFKDVKPLVRRAFNTIAGEEGTTTDFKDEGDAPFESMDALVSEMSKLPKDDFPMAVAMLAQTAKAHGKDVEGFMNKVTRRFTRSGKDLFESSGDANLLRNLSDGREQFQGIKKQLSEGKALFVLGSPGEMNADRVASEFLISDSGFGPKIGNAGEDPRSGFDKGFDNIIVDPLLGLTGSKRSEWIEVPKEIIAELDTAMEQIENGVFYGAELRNWKETVAKIGSDNKFVNDWVYGTVGSLPEMIGAFTSNAGMSLVANAQTGRNLAELNRTNPDLDPDKAMRISETAGLGYSLLNRLEGKILFRKMPGSGALSKKILGRFATALGGETLQEMAQEGMFPLTKKLYAAVDADMPDVNLFGEGGEVNAIIAQAPQMAFQAIPLVALGVGGKAAVDYFDSRSLQKILKNGELLAEIGVPKPIIRQLGKATNEQAAEIIQENRAEILSNFQTELSIPESQVSVDVNPDGTFDVSGDAQVINVRSPEEAAAAGMQIEAGQTASAPPLPPTSTKDANIDRNFEDPNQQVFHTFLAPGFTPEFDAGENKSRVKDALPPVPDSETGTITNAARRRFGLQTFLGQRDVPSKTLQKTLNEGTRKAEGVEAQFDDIARALDDRVKRHVRKQPSSSRDSAFQEVQQNAYLALRGDVKAAKKLPKSIRKVVKEGRDSIDAYTNELIQSGDVSGDLVTTLGKNIGSYVTREFKAFDPKAKWNYQTVKKQHPEIFQKALAEIMTVSSVTAKEADLVLRGMLDSSRSQKFYSGTGTVGKVNITNFIKRKDLSDPILDVLGEVRNPVVNIKNTGSKVSRIVVTNSTQAHMAEQMIAAGLASRTPNPELRHTERLGEESYSFPGIDETTGEAIVLNGKRTAKSFSGFGTIYVDPELHAPLTAHFNPGVQKGKNGFNVAFDTLAKVTGIGKFMQVILNPAAYPTNLLGGVATEIFNGRVSLDGKGRKAYVKFGSGRNFGKLPKDPYGVTDQANFYEKTGADFVKEGGVNSLGRNQLNTEMQQQGIRDNSVFAEDLNQTVEIGYGEKAAKAVRAASKLYQAPDNAAKRSAFVHELDKWVRAEPNSTMDVLIQKAAEDVRLTTQNYDMVPALLKSFSQRGVIVPTYISFSYELFRNTINTVKLASREIRSGNPVLAKAGYSRVAGMLAIGGLMFALNQVASSWMTGLDDDEREELRSMMPPWLEQSEVVMMGADNNSLAYFDASYLIPHQIFYNAAARAVKGDTAEEKFSGTAKALFAPIGGLNIFNQTAAEVLTNQKRGGGKVYNEQITPEGTPGYFAEVGGHFTESMFTPGFVRTYRKVQKAKAGEVGFAGSSATMDDVWGGLFGIRPYRMDTSTDAFVEDNLIGFAFDSREAKSHTSDRQQAKRDDLGKADADEAVTQAQQRMLTDFSAKVKAFKRLNISNERIKRAAQKVSVPRYMRAELKKLLSE